MTHQDHLVIQKAHVQNKRFYKTLSHSLNKTRQAIVLYDALTAANQKNNYELDDKFCCPIK